MLFRSEKINYYEVMIPFDAAWQTMNALGSISSVQFIDCNEGNINAKLPYTDYIRRSDDSIARIRDFDKFFD